MKCPELLSFFSGGGFLDMGFENEGFKIVWSNEYDKHFADMYQHGVTSWRRHEGINTPAVIKNRNSVVLLSAEEILREAFPKGVPELFGMIGGPPCQDFSMNGSREGFNGERGKLTHLYIDLIKEIKPAFFVMENVPGLVKHKEQKQRLFTLLSVLDADYFYDHRILNSLDYGVPQHRERLFVIGVSRNLLPEKQMTGVFTAAWFEHPVYSGALKKFKWVTDGTSEDTGDLLLPPEELTVLSCLADVSDPGTANADEFFNLRVADEKLNQIAEGDTRRPSFKRLHRNRYSPTACYGNNEVHLHPFENRRLSVREALRIQGIPDSYILPKNFPLSKKFKMIGNGVPFPLACAVAVTVKRVLCDLRARK